MVVVVTENGGQPVCGRPGSWESREPNGGKSAKRREMNPEQAYGAILGQSGLWRRTGGGDAPTGERGAFG